MRLYPHPARSAPSLDVFGVTGTDKVPLDGFEPPFTLSLAAASVAPNSLPRAHTCFNQLVLPVYDTPELLQKQLLFAADNSEGFELS